MNQDLDNELCEKYSRIFADRHKPMTETCMCWGFECGDGWFNIIDQLCADIQSHIDWKNGQRKLLLKDNPHKIKIPEEVEQVVAEQVKEKFGILRFYYRGGDDTVNGMVSMAERISQFICIGCGGAGQLKNHRGWISNLCSNCEQKKQQKDL